MTDLDFPRASQATRDRIRHLVGLDRTYVANRCKCGAPLLHESDDDGTGVSIHLVCADDCGYPGERIA